MKDSDGSSEPRLLSALRQLVPSSGRQAPMRWLFGFVFIFALTFLGGVTMYSFGTPMPWMLGALCAAAPLAMALSPGHILLPEVPRGFRNFFIPVIGTMIGSNFTPQLLASMTQWWPSLLAMCVLTPFLQTVLYLWYRRAMRFDAVTAYFSASPGGLIEAIEWGTERGGDPRVIAAMHFLRIVLSVAGIPLILVLAARFGMTHAAADPHIPPAVTGRSQAHGLELLIFALICLCGARLGRLLHLPAPFMLGPMVLSAVLTIFGVIDFAVPAPFVIVAQWVVGTVLGMQFAGLPKSRFIGISIAAVTGTIIAFVTVVISVLVMIAITDIPAELMILSFAPGGLVEMGLIALSMGINPMFVTGHHVLRVFLSVVMTPSLFALLKVPGLKPPPGDGARRP